jgi:glycogen(starch) synthase
MRVLFWAESFWPHIGGAQLGALELILALRKRGYEFIVVTRQDDLSEPPVDQYEGVLIYRFPFWKAFADRNLRQLQEARKGFAKLKHDFAPDLVHLHQVGPGTLFYLESTKVHPVPLLVTLTGMDFEKQCGLQVFESILRLSDWATVKSKAILHRARQIVPSIVHRSSVVYRGRRDPLPELHSPPTILPRIVCVGRLATEKGFDQALSAFATIVKHFPEVEMVMAGDGPQRSALEQQAESLGLTQMVKWLGWVPPEQIPALLATAQAVLIPSRSEGLPRVAVEAALMARPVVATKVGGIPEVVIHQRTGLLVEPENEGALADAVIYLLSNKEKAVTMGCSARSLVLKKFNMEQCVNSYQALYEQLAQSKSA